MRRHRPHYPDREHGVGGRIRQQRAQPPIELRIVARIEVERAPNERAGRAATSYARDRTARINAD
jgi:hypothetical protein